MLKERLKKLESLDSEHLNTTATHLVKETDALLEEHQAINKLLELRKKE